MLNVHGSLLPRWRGAAPVVHAIKNGDDKTGVTIMKIRPHKFDIGEILAVRETDIGPDETRPVVTGRLARMGAQLLVEVLHDLDVHMENARQQGEEGVTKAPVLEKSASFLDFHSLTAIQVIEKNALFY